MFGVGGDAGKTTIRLRHAWGQWKQIGAGQTNSQFMDVDVFPNTVEYWGPNGMLFFRNAQVFYELFDDGTSNARIAVEAPGASGDAGVLSDRVELQNVKPRFPSPDFTGHYRKGAKWGYVQVGGALRYLAYDDLIPTDKFDLNGHVWAWGISISSGLNVGKSDKLHFQLVEGAGVENYFNDAPVDVGIKSNPGNTVTPVVGEALGDFGLVLFFDHTWNPRLSSSVGYSRVDITNSTISGNTVNGSATAAGGITNIGIIGGNPTLVLTNSTVYGNNSDGASGTGGISQNTGSCPSGCTNTIKLRNTIVAGNTRSGSTPSDISGFVDFNSSSNLIGTGGSGGLSGANGNQVNVADVKLGSLANNGGPTQTHALLPNSPAFDAGEVRVNDFGLANGDAYTAFSLKCFGEPLPAAVRAHNFGPWPVPLAVTFQILGDDRASPSSTAPCNLRSTLNRQFFLCIRIIRNAIGKIRYVLRRFWAAIPEKTVNRECTRIDTNFLVFYWR
jgi:hypothetical protein